MVTEAIQISPNWLERLKRFSFLDDRNRLQSLGCFSEVDIHVDTCKGGGQSDYEVTFYVKELKRIIGSVNTLVGNQEGCVMVGGKVSPDFYAFGQPLKIYLRGLLTDAIIRDG